jgi:hypothetical protein
MADALPDFIYITDIENKFIVYSGGIIFYDTHKVAYILSADETIQIPVIVDIHAFI